VLIGLNGRRQAGKDTVYERAAKLMADVVEVERASFADLLYESAAAALGVTVEFLRMFKSDPWARVVVLMPGPDDEEIVRQELNLREFLQRYGTEAHRDIFGPDFWVEQLEASGKLHHEGRIVFVTDVRFPNEAAVIERAGGAVVEVIGPEGRVTSDAHPSEAPLPEELIDAVITNTVRDDGFRTLDGQVDTLLRLHLGHDPHSRCV
jgi:hypothetical protein